MLENHNKSHDKSYKLQSVCQAHNMTLIRIIQSYLLLLLCNMAVKFTDRAFGKHAGCGRVKEKEHNKIAWSLDPSF